MQKTFFPEEFLKKYEKIMGKESKDFFDFSARKIPKSIWVNSLKITQKELMEKLENKGWQLKQLFHENAFLLENAEKPGQSEEFKLGLFNLQEKASMLPAIVLAPEQGERVLDATAAPGNKTLQLSCLVEGKGSIVAVEKNPARFKSLCYNIKKFGTKNVKARKGNLLQAATKKLFDKVLLDAPCSSEGLVRKDFDALRHWSQKLVERKAKLQKRMIAKCIDMLKENGVLVYSTCSLSPEENEEVLQWVTERKKIEIVEIEIKKFKVREGMTEYNGKKFDAQIKNAIRIYPQDNDSQSFFVAKIRKK